MIGELLQQPVVPTLQSMKATSSDRKSLLSLISQGYGGVAPMRKLYIFSDTLPDFRLIDKR